MHSTRIERWDSPMCTCTDDSAELFTIPVSNEQPTQRELFPDAWLPSRYESSTPRTFRCALPYLREGPTGAVWDPTAFELLTFLVALSDAAAPSRTLYKSALQRTFSIIDSLQKSAHINLTRDHYRDVLILASDHGTVEEWRIDYREFLWRSEDDRLLWRTILGDHDGEIFARQVVDGYTVSRCARCQVAFYATCVDAFSKMPALAWMTASLPDGAPLPGPGNPQYETIANSICWDCAFDALDSPPLGKYVET